MNRLEYKGYWTNIEYSAKDKVLYGKIEGIGDLVNFESNDASGIENEFHLAVDDYLEFCRELGKEPERAYKGSFNVRISPNLHKKLAIYSAKQRVSLNDSVEQAIKYYLDNAMEDRFLKKFPIIIKDIQANITDISGIFTNAYQSEEQCYDFGNGKIFVKQEQ